MMIEIDVEFRDGNFKNSTTGQSIVISDLISSHLKATEGMKFTIKIWWNDRELNFSFVSNNTFVTFRQLELHAMKIARKEDFSHLKPLIKEIFANSNNFSELISNLKSKSDGSDIFKYLIELSAYYMDGGTDISLISTYSRHLDVKTETERIVDAKKAIKSI